MPKVSETVALIHLYRTINGPRKAGPKWVTYSREQTEAMLDVLHQVLEARGCEFRPEVK